MKILVLGATGYVGSRVVPALLADGHQVVAASSSPPAPKKFAWGDLVDWVPVATSRDGQPFTGIATIVGEVAGTAPRTATIIDPQYGSSGFLRLRVRR